MKKKNIIVLLTVVLMALFISACGNSSAQNDDTNNNNKEKDTNEKVITDDIDDESNKSKNDNDTNKNSEEKNDKSNFNNNGDDASDENSNQDKNTNEDSSSDEESDVLAKYSAEEIEYARIWLQLGDTQDIDELNVQHISSGTPLNPEDETSIDYPKDVIHLSGSRLVEGSITYSGNGDGTIKLYNKIPHRWDGKNPAGEDVYKQILEDTKQVFIDIGDDKKVEELIKKLNIQS